MTSAASDGAEFDVTPPTDEQFEQLTARLEPEEAEVLIDHETEAPFCGALLHEGRAGIFTCRLCGLPLFQGGAKFESNTGWPSFTSPLQERHLRYTSEASFRMARTEISCARCGAHQGHVFRDGPPPTRQRFFINSVSPEFTPSGDALPDKLDRGSPEGRPWGS
jgi:peptide-methionine (R)-S-oxide reductase